MAPKRRPNPQPAAPAPARPPAAPARPAAPAPAAQPAAVRQQAGGPAWNAPRNNSPQQVAAANQASDLINRAANAGSAEEASRLISQAQGIASGASGSSALLDLINRQGQGIQSRISSDTGGGGEAPERDYMREYYESLERQRKTNAIAVIRGVLSQYGLESLYSKIVEYVQNGYDADAVMALIRTTPEYKQRFPAMDALAKKGRAISEAEYINYEQTASGLERRYGLPGGMLMGKVTDLLSNEVSATELNDRVVLASAASIQAPQDLRDTFQRFYGIDQGGLTAYFLDPTVATPLLEKRYGTAIIGREAAAQGVGLDVYGAENLQSLGITQEQARQGFGEVAGARELTTGRGDVVSQGELISGTFGQSQEAQRAIERARGGRTARFQGGGQFAAGEGQLALGSAAR